jgi:hypothetical protein
MKLRPARFVLPGVLVVAVLLNWSCLLSPAWSQTHGGGGGRGGSGGSWHGGSGASWHGGGGGSSHGGGGGGGWHSAGHWHGGGWGGGVFIGWPLWYPYGYPYWYSYPSSPYPDYSSSTVMELEPPVYVQQDPQPQQYWYYCQGPSQGYYPYVKECPRGWLPVVPQPSEPLPPR